jgi:site-specific recombinase
MAVNWIRSRRHIDGASLALTYRLMKIQQTVKRMEQLLDLMDVAFGEWNSKPAMDLFMEITLAEIQRFNLMRFVGHNMELLAYQVTEHTGKAGEHYITKSRDEWVDMFRSAAIGGVVVAVLAVLKVLISKLGLPPIPEGFAYGTLYATGFVFILYIGGTLATKQPAMTASTLAQALDESTSSKQAMDNLSEVLIRTSRSQFAALLGNYMVAFPAAVFLCLPFYFSEHDLMSPEKATHIIESFHPYKSLAFWYAAVAGIGLFLSGLFAGFADNWFIFNNVGSRLRQAELLKKLVGTHNLDRAIKAIDHNLGFWVGNISLGYYLGMAGSVGLIMGLPINTAHITFSTATFGAAMVSLKFQYSLALIALTAVSIFCFGLINLSVSFTLSLIVAVKSRRIKFSQTPDLLRLLGQKFRQRPMEFFVPPRDKE